jgi:hypothetical protein
MSLVTNLMRVCGAVAIAAMLSLVPSVAAAHAGHAHGHGAAAHAAPSVVKKAEAPATTRIAARVSAEIKSTQSVPVDPAGDTGCGDRGCCGNGCTACCSGIVAQGTALTPPLSSVSLGLPQAARGSGLGADALRRPPKAYA